jgi:MscS family membrane protein
VFDKGKVPSMSLITRRWMFPLMVGAALALVPSPGRAQTGAAAGAPSPSTALPGKATVAPDSPRVAYRSFMSAAHNRRWQDAARYVPVQPADLERSVKLATRLKAVLDTLYTLDADAISAESSGRLDDDLPNDVEGIGEVEILGRKEPIRLLRMADAAGVFWTFSPTTVSRIDVWYDNLPNRWLRDDLTSAGFPRLLEAGPFDILWWQWIALPLVALLATGVAFAFHIIGRATVSRLTGRTRWVWDDRLAESVGAPMTLAVGIILSLPASC